MQNFEDRRIFQRFSVKLPLRCLNLNSGKEFAAQTNDISANGIGLVTEENLPAESPLEMWLAIPDKCQPLYARAEVVWSNMMETNKYRVGVRLEKTDLMGLSRVLRIIDTRQN
jgi:c-di-GMP-binding flagellar brake protein YcgR